MEILSAIVLVLMAIEIVGMPLLFGEGRGPYGYKVWIGAILTAAMIAPLCLRVLGVI
jgi:hypothetical protein